MTEVAIPFRHRPWFYLTLRMRGLGRSIQGTAMKARMSKVFWTAAWWGNA